MNIPSATTTTTTTAAPLNAQNQETTTSPPITTTVLPIAPEQKSDLGTATADITATENLIQNLDAAASYMQPNFVHYIPPGVPIIPQDINGEYIDQMNNN